jgi:2-polyprenyl-3-methyl-5-hydroxy-6-metoxy-1,4-benzoquinol methylase
MDIEEYSKYKQFYIVKAPNLLLKYLNSFNWKIFLDLGCGDGSLLYVLNKDNYFKDKTVYAVDLSLNRINLIKNINESFVCFVGDACNIKEIKDNSIDFIVSEQVIEHVESDEKMVSEINRVLKKNGVIYLSTVFKKWYGWYFYRCKGKWTLDPTHLREYTKDEQMLDLFKKNNFDILENKKTLVKRSFLDFVLKRLNVKRDIFIKYPFLNKIRNLNFPIPGYYIWEIVCQKK